MLADVREAEAELHANGAALPARRDANEGELALVELEEPAPVRGAHGLPALALACGPATEAVAVVAVPDRDAPRAPVGHREPPQSGVAVDQRAEVGFRRRLVVTRGIVVADRGGRRRSARLDLGAPGRLEPVDDAPDLARPPAHPSALAIPTALLDRSM